MKLSNLELSSINGGGISFGVGVCIVAGLAFLAGALDGWMNPIKCRG